jgi:hypothetical protein
MIQDFEGGFIALLRPLNRVCFGGALLRVGQVACSGRYLTQMRHRTLIVVLPCTIRSGSVTPVLCGLQNTKNRKTRPEWLGAANPGVTSVTCPTQPRPPSPLPCLPLWFLTRVHGVRFRVRGAGRQKACPKSRDGEDPHSERGHNRARGIQAGCLVLPCSSLPP